MTAAQIFDLHGKVALVTGASSGLGVRFAECLAENGAAVVLVARRADRLADLKARIEKSGGRALAVEADVRDRAAMAAAFDAAEKNFGTVTILVNNAGVAPCRPRRRHAGRGMAAHPLDQSRRGVLLRAGSGAADAGGRLVAAPSSISPPCSASASPRASSPMPPPRPA